MRLRLSLPSSDRHPADQATTPIRRRPPRPFIWRALLGCLVLLLCSAAAGAVFVLEQVHAFVQDISVNRVLKVAPGALAQTGSGKPETLLLVGDDTRTGFKYYNAYVPNLANEMLLIRIDPSKPYISMMSIPRELWVSITPPGGATYTNRLNSAYTYGATTLLQTIRDVTGIGVNHVIATTFGQFETAINTLGCVYTTVDERYYHDNADGGAQYQNVNLLPGYQCLDGSEAEQFVSYRHTDTSQIRDARDQAFLLAAKAQYGPELTSNLGQFEKTFGKTVQTDAGLRSQGEILGLVNLLINAEGLRVRQVPFTAENCTNTCPYGDLTATSAQIHASVENFLDGPDVTPTRQTATLGRQLSHHRGPHFAVTPTLAANLATEQADAAKLSFTAEFPKVQDLAGSIIPVSPECTEVVAACIRNYLIHAPGGGAYPAYVEVFSNGDLGQYYDVQGTTWTSLPLLAKPEQTLTIDRRTYELFYEGAHLETIAWHSHGAVYWVHNTLTDAIGNGELLAIAEQTAPVDAIRTEPGRRMVRTASAPPFPAKSPSAGTPWLRSIGQIGGLTAVILFPLGLIVVRRRRRRVETLRAELSGILARTTVLEAQLVSRPAHRAPSPTSRPPGPPGPPRTPSPSIFSATSGSMRRYRSRPPWVRPTFGLGLVAAVGLAGFAVISGQSSKRSRPASGQIPSASVAVLNAGEVPHAARQLATALTHRHVHVVAVANLDAAAPVRYEVLYVPGAAEQARLLAHTVKAQHPRIAPVDPAAAEAAGSQARLILVIP